MVHLFQVHTYTCYLLAHQTIRNTHTCTHAHITTTHSWASQCQHNNRDCTMALEGLIVHLFERSTSYAYTHVSLAKRDKKPGTPMPYRVPHTHTTHTTHTIANPSACMRVFVCGTRTRTMRCDQRLNELRADHKPRLKCVTIMLNYANRYIIYFN